MRLQSLVKKGSPVKELKKKYRWLVPFPRRGTLRRWFPPFETRNLAHLIKARKITLVLDVGANKGQYAEKLRSAGYSGRIASFEPLAAPHAALEAAAARDPNWRIHPRCALGAEAGEITINVYADDSLSSPRQLVGGSSGAMQLDHVESCRLETLDAVFRQYAAPKDRVLLKVDVQGFEREVLEGARQVLSQIDAVQIELSLSAMYQEEAGYLELLTRLDALGFYPVFFLPVTNRQKPGIYKQIDALLFRKSGAARVEASHKPMLVGAA